MTSGIDLKVERVRAGATQRDIGRYMGVSAARVSVYENRGNSTRALEEETVTRYRAAVEMFIAERKSGEPQTWRVELMGTAIGNEQEQYRTAKAQAREDVRRYPSHRVVEVQIERETPAAVLLGYVDGLMASGVLPVVLDGRGTVVNRRIG